MSEQNKNFSVFDYPKMPELAPEVRAEVPKKNFRERLKNHKVAEKLGAIACGALLTFQLSANADKIASSELWPADSVEIVAASYPETVKPNHTLWLVFGGYGQKYSTNAAQELHNAMDNNDLVASVAYPSQGFTIEELANHVIAYLHENKIEKLNVVGVSLGTPTAIMTLDYIQQHIKESYPLYMDAVDMQGVTNGKLPQIDYFIAYSSPADVQDAIPGDLAQNVTKRILDICNKLDCYPGIRMKALYSAVDGEGDLFRTLDILDPYQWMQQNIGTVKQIFNPTAPGMVKSQTDNVLFAYDAQSQSNGLKIILGPNTRFGYTHPSGADPTVNDSQAYRKYSVELKKFNVQSDYVPTGEPGHANTYASAKAVSKWLADLSVTNPGAVFNQDMP